MVIWLREQDSLRLDISYLHPGRAKFLVLPLARGHRPVRVRVQTAIEGTTLIYVLYILKWRLEDTSRYEKPGLFLQTPM